MFYSRKKTLAEGNLGGLSQALVLNPPLKMPVSVQDPRWPDGFPRATDPPWLAAAEAHIV